MEWFLGICILLVLGILTYLWCTWNYNKGRKDAQKEIETIKSFYKHK